MNEDICRWIIEFMLRSSMDDHLLKRVLAVILVPNKDFRLKKTVLLRAIEIEISEADIREKLLEIFEMIEVLDKSEGCAIMESMKAAYCAVAVECTVKYLLVEDPSKHGRYFDAVSRIWRGRATELETLGKSELVSRELKTWKDEVEGALTDKDISKKLANMNSRYHAMKLVKDYLGEAWAVMGPSFLQLSASLMDKKTTNKMQSLQLERETDKTTIASKDADGSGGIELPPQRENCVRPEQASGRSQPETSRIDLVNSDQDLYAINGFKRSGIVGMNTERVQELPTETAEGQESAVEEVAVLQNPSPRRENLKISVLPRCKSLASHRRVRGGVKISHLEDLENDGSSEKYICPDTPEVNRVQEALKTSSLELQAVVKDPLPDALRIAESVAHDLAEKNKTLEHSSEDRNDTGVASPVINKDAVPLQSVAHDLPGKNKTREHSSEDQNDAANPTITKDAVPVQSVNASENAYLKNPGHDHPTIVPRPGIMERNSTACTYEWNDSIDDLPEGGHANKLHLPSPKRKVISPLKKYEENKIVRRRRCKKWSLLEEDTLRTAVQRFGKGNWKLILNSYRDIFDERTEVDLKDKWRNMTRYY